MNDREKLTNSKLIRSLQLLELAKANNRISDASYEKQRDRYWKKTWKLQQQGLIGEDESYLKNLPLPDFITKEPSVKTEKSYRIFGGLGLKVFLLMCVFLCISYFMPMVMSLSAPFLFMAFGCPLLYLAVTYFLDKYEPEPLHFVIGAFLWGVVSTVLALFLNQMLAGYFGIVAAIIMAGLTEEFVKGLGIYRLAQHEEFNDTLDAIVYGFAAGLGFAAMENVFYYSQYIDPKIIQSMTGWGSEVIQFVSLRASLCALGHATFTSAIAITLAKAKLEKGTVIFPDFVKGYLLAALIHGVFNANCIFFGDTSIFLNASIVVIALWVFWGIVKKSWKLQRSWGWHLVVKKQP